MLMEGITWTGRLDQESKVRLNEWRGSADHSQFRMTEVVIKWEEYYFL